IPPRLESQLLAIIPKQLPATLGPRLRRRRPFWIGLAGALTAACLLAILAWPRGYKKQENREKSVAKSNQEIEATEAPLAQSFSVPAPDSIAAFRVAFRGAAKWDEAEIATFAWPVEEKSPALKGVISRDLFE